jgi:hypothetical protein
MDKEREKKKNEREHTKGRDEDKEYKKQLAKMESKITISEPQEHFGGKKLYEEEFRQTWRMKPKVSSKLPPAFNSVSKPLNTKGYKIQNFQIPSFLHFPKTKIRKEIKTNDEAAI